MPMVRQLIQRADQRGNLDMHKEIQEGPRTHCDFRLDSIAINNHPGSTFSMNLQIMLFAKLSNSYPDGISLISTPSPIIPAQNCVGEKFSADIQVI